MEKNALISFLLASLGNRVAITHLCQGEDLDEYEAEPLEELLRDLLEDLLLEEYDRLRRFGLLGCLGLYARFLHLVL